jgi:NAD(P)-dependent dehydrogenase (short-subunit alcohol dehydrogenase family)
MTRSGQLADRVAVVTGAGRGIGRAIALRYATEGAIVVVSSRTAAELAAVLREAGHDADRGLAVVADAFDPDGARQPVLAALERFGRVDVLVNNVGGNVRGNADPVAGDDDAFERALTLNLTSAWRASTAALPSMREHGFGRIVNIGSGASKHAVASVGYTTAKHGLVGLTRQLAAATARSGITVNCLCPGWTRTSATDFEAIAARSGRTPEEVQARAESDSLQRRILEPDELTGMATLLAGDEGRGITGQVINVDGGYRV